jgi:hypothetical protein
MPAKDKMEAGHSYNAQVHYRIVQAIKLGATKELAAKAGGVGARTLHRWIADAKRNGKESTFAKLYQDMVQAEASGANHALACIVKAAKDGRWQAAAWLLERKYGYRRDGVKELREYAAIPGDLEAHSAEILGEIRRLRISATDDGSHIAAANLLRMEAEMVQTQRAEEIAHEEAQHSKASETELLSVIKGSIEDMPRTVLDQLAQIIDAKRRRAS